MGVSRLKLDEETVAILRSYLGNQFEVKGVCEKCGKVLSVSSSLHYEFDLETKSLSIEDRVFPDEFICTNCLTEMVKDKLPELIPPILPYTITKRGKIYTINVFGRKIQVETIEDIKRIVHETVKENLYNLFPSYLVYMDNEVKIAPMKWSDEYYFETPLGGLKFMRDLAITRTLMSITKLFTHEKRVRTFLEEVLVFALATQSDIVEAIRIASRINYVMGPSLKKMIIRKGADNRYARNFLKELKVFRGFLNKREGIAKINDLTYSGLKLFLKYLQPYRFYINKHNHLVLETRNSYIVTVFDSSI